MLQNSGIKKKIIVIAQEFLATRLALREQEDAVAHEFSKVLIFFVEDFLEKTPIKHIAGVLVTCGRKSSNRSKQKQSAT